MVSVSLARRGAPDMSAKRYPPCVTGRTSRPHPEVAIACAVLATAIRDMRRRDPAEIRHRIKATVWLGSKTASMWFDAARVEQEYALRKVDWTTHAQHLLDGEAERVAYWDSDESLHSRALSPEQLGVLEGALAHLDSHAATPVAGWGPSGSTTAE